MAGEIQNEEGKVQELKGGGPAFPATVIKEFTGDLVTMYTKEDVPGMSLRDYFAAQALTGILAAITERWHANDWLAAAKEHNKTTAQLVAISAYERADAMLEARKEKP